MDSQWSSEALGRLRPPVAIALAVAVVLAVGITARSQGAATTPEQPKPWPLHHLAPAPSARPQPVSSGCRSSPADTVSPGVTPTAIRVASTVTLDGPDSELLSSAPVGMRAIVNKINRAGGICGRRIELTTVNDSGDGERGHVIVRRFLEEDYFALVGMPGAGGLAAAIDTGDIDKAGMPVVGTSGTAEAEFKSGWVWPVGTSTSSIMRIAAADARARGARRFALLRDANSRFAHEGAEAFRDQVERDGGLMMAEIALDPAERLADKAYEFRRSCGGGAHRCDAVVLLLSPPTALAWRDAHPGGGGRAGSGGLTYGAHTLFGDEFAAGCARWCEGMMVWAPYNPPIPPVDTKPGVAKYQQDVRAERAGIDFRNQFLEGAYLGMSLFVEAAGKCSPNLTRDCMKNALNTMEFKTDLANTLKWGATSRHANKYAQAFQIEASGGSFNGWRSLRTGWVKDPAM